MPHPLSGLQLHLQSVSGPPCEVSPRPPGGQPQLVWVFPDPVGAAASRPANETTIAFVRLEMVAPRPLPELRPLPFSLSIFLLQLCPFWALLLHLPPPPPSPPPLVTQPRVSQNVVWFPLPAAEATLCPFLPFRLQARQQCCF